MCVYRFSLSLLHVMYEMHMFYKKKLVTCVTYLPIHATRQPQPFGQ